MIYFCSDLHFQHRRILEYCPGRPFSSLDEMNAGLVRNWNSVVGKDDLVFFLGDFAFQVNDKMEEHKETVRQLNGSVVMIPGNHDSPKKLREMGFKYIASEAYVTIDGIVLWLNHFPLVNSTERDEARPDCKRPKAQRDYDYVLHGHSHNTRDKILTKDNWGKVVGADIGVDGRYDQGCTPWAWDELKDVILNG